MNRIIDYCVDTFAGWFGSTGLESEDVREEHRPELPVKRDRFWKSSIEGLTLERVNRIPLYKSNEVPEDIVSMSPNNDPNERFQKIRVKTKLMNNENMTIANLKRELKYQLLSRGADAGINYIRYPDGEYMIGTAIPAKRI